MIEYAAVALGTLLMFVICTGFLNTKYAAQIETEERLKRHKSQLNPAGMDKRDLYSSRATGLDVIIERFVKRRKGSKLASSLERLEDQLYDSGIHIVIYQFIAIWLLALLLGIFGAIALTESVLVGIGVGAVVLIAPVLFIKISKKRRKKKLEEQLVDAITILINALKAGHSFQSALQSIAKEMPAPASEEFGRMFRETQHGMQLEESMNRMCQRVQSDDLEMICTAVTIQQQVGGNLSQILVTIQKTINQRLMLKKEIKSKTASGRMSGYIVGGLPIVILVALKFMNPDYTSFFFAERTGHLLLALCAGLEIFGFMIIMKITKIEM